jgi:S-DNA-T family DNA segregation ATPase FtsK/SpoIIIE
VARARKTAGRPKQAAWKRPVTGILLAGIAVVALLGLWSYGPRAPGANWAGPVGYTVAGALLEVAGIGAYAAAVFLLAAAIALVAGRPRVSFSSSASWILFCLSLVALVHLGVRARLQGHAPGGLVGALIAGGARAALSTWGAAVLIGAIGAAALVVATDLWALRAAFAAGRLGFAGGARAIKGAAGAISRVRAAGEDEQDDAEPFEADPEVRITLESRAKDSMFRLATDSEAPQDPRLPFPPSSDPGRRRKPLAGATSTPPALLSSPSPEAMPMAPTIVEPRPPPRGGARKEERKEDQESAGAGFTLHGGRKSFTPPPISILTGEVNAIAPIDREGLTATAEKLRQKLASFGIQGQVTQIRPGPVVTMFEFLPAAGVKVSRIASLADDLAMAMEALRVRIVAPIPGRGVVGIEVPNKERQMVVLRELAEQDAFQKSHSKLAMCLGKDIEGMPYIADLAKMPHLLIAGTTGSGKSVAVNSMIVSMLLRASPEEVRFLMVDPKMLELSVYEGIPHLLLPVVTDAKKAAMALRWGVEEMERRYQLLAECGVRNIASYNKKVEKEGDAARRAHKPAKEKRVVDLTDPQLSIPELQQAAAAGEVAREESDNPAVQLLRENERKLAAADDADAPGGEPEGASHEPLRKLPYLVIIIDELADLMMVASREVETYIARLAQMARASGIHLMVATQRPSTDVVTGVIKANFPARISFQVASRHDSGTIINSPGAENLLGMGDMLILPPGTSTLTRVHGPYVEEKEIHAVVEHWKAQGAPVYDPNILKPRAEDGDGMPEDDQGPDELYDQAIAAVSDMRFISISLLQRKLRVGYNRAARMIERMERDGIVGPADGAKPREVLIRPIGELPGAGA